MILDAIDNWYRTKLGYLTFALAELLIAYLFASLAIDSGNLLEYAVTIVLSVGAVQNFVRIFRPIKNERKRR